MALASPSRHLRSAGAEVHYSPGENLERIDVALIGEAAKQIDMAAYVLTDSAVIEALREAAERGVTVRIWRDANMAAKVGDFDVEAQLGGRAQGLELRSNAPGGQLMHLKGYCVDIVSSELVGKFQPVRRDAPGERPRGVERASVCAGFDAKFNGAWPRG